MFWKSLFFIWNMKEFEKKKNLIEGFNVLKKKCFITFCRITLLSIHVNCMNSYRFLIEPKYYILNYHEKVRIHKLKLFCR